jgi:hypothetical protein
MANRLQHTKKEQETQRDQEKKTRLIILTAGSASINSSSHRE